MQLPLMLIVACLYELIYDFHDSQLPLCSLNICYEYLLFGKK